MSEQPSHTSHDSDLMLRCAKQVLLGRWRGCLVAVKMLRESSLSSGRTAVLEEFKQEAEMLQRLRHPNILNFYGACIQCHPVRLPMAACYKFGDRLRDVQNLVQHCLYCCLVCPYLGRSSGKRTARARHGIEARNGLCGRDSVSYLPCLPCKVWHARGLTP